MTIAGQLSITASDDPRFKAGDSIGLVLESDLDIVVTHNVAVKSLAPTPEATTTEPSTVDEAATVDGAIGGDTATVTAPATA